MNKSFWIENTKNSQEKFPTLQQDKGTDICIIGGGLTGLTTAYYLSKTNYNVILLEKEELGYHTSRTLNSKNNKSTWPIL